MLALCARGVVDFRYALSYHSIPQIAAGYAVGIVAGAAWYILTEHVPRTSPSSAPGRIRAGIENVWVGVGGVGGWQLGGAQGGWGEGWVFGVTGMETGKKKQ
jgi:dolichyldiphosphatase